MLIVLFAAIGLGLFGHRIRYPEMRLVVALATLFMLAYLVHPSLMT
jgi:hypothetical protein